MKLLIDIPVHREMPPLVRSGRGGRIYSSSKQKQIQVFPLTLMNDESELLYIYSLFRGRADANYHYRQSDFFRFGVEYVREGSLYARQRETWMRIEPGDAFFFQPGVDSEIMTGPEKYCAKDSFCINGKLLMPFLKSSGLESLGFRSGFDWQRFERVLDRLQDSSCEKGRNNRISHSVLVYEILEILAFSSSRIPVHPGMAALLNFIRENLDQPLTLPLLARHYGCSQTTLRQRFETVYGKTPHQKLIEIRMEFALKLLLSRPDLSIKEIAGQTGYRNSLNFSTAFRKMFGHSPLRYRELRRHELSYSPDQKKSPPE